MDRLPPAANTLKKRGDFLRIQQGGKKFRGRCLLMMVAAGAAVAPRIGYTVSRKVGGAVQRNRVKRRLRALWQAEGMAQAPTGAELVVIAQPSAGQAPFAALRQDFLWLLNRAASLAARG
jgi:ribonuclease P protein component